jgi:hypothetical protein
MLGFITHSFWSMLMVIICTLELKHHKEKQILSHFSKEVGLEICAEKTKYMLNMTSPECREYHNIKTDYESFQNVVKSKYL